MPAFENLLVRRENTIDKRRMISLGNFASSRQSTEIIHTFKHNQPSDARGRQHIAGEACQRIGAETVGKQMISTDALIGNSNRSCLGCSLESGREHIGPTVVSVGGGSVAIGDGVTEHHYRSCFRWSLDVNF